MDLKTNINEGKSCIGMNMHLVMYAFECLFYVQLYAL